MNNAGVVLTEVQGREAYRSRDDVVTHMFEHVAPSLIKSLLKPTAIYEMQ